MGEEPAQRSLTESWRFVSEQRKRMEAQVAQLSALEVAEFTQAARHIVEVAQELYGLANHTHQARLEDEIRRFSWAVSRAAEAAEQLQLILAKAGLAPPSSMDLLPMAPAPTAQQTIATQNSAEAQLGQLENAGNGRKSAAMSRARR
jgi:hypothetical protein